jgi:hypothetical protein
MPDKHVVIAMPTYTGMIHNRTWVSILEGILTIASKGIKVTPLSEEGNAMIAHGRDVLCARFLDTDATDLVFLDHDVTFQGEDLVKLVEHPVDIVAGIYPQRRDPPNYSVRFIDGVKELWADPETGLLEVAGVPAGFLRITRDCLIKMTLAYPEKRFRDHHCPHGFAHALWDNIHEGDLYFGEDYSFCERWRRIGGKVWADPEIELGHIGHKHFIGTFGDWLKARPQA